MKYSDKKEILSWATQLSDEELEKEYYDCIFDSLGSEAEEMYENGYDMQDILDREQIEKYLSEKADLLESLCIERGIELWNDEGNKGVSAAEKYPYLSTKDDFDVLVEKLDEETLYLLEEQIFLWNANVIKEDGDGNLYRDDGFPVCDIAIKWYEGLEDTQVLISIMSERMYYTEHKKYSVYVSADIDTSSKADLVLSDQTCGYKSLLSAKKNSKTLLLHLLRRNCREGIISGTIHGVVSFTYSSYEKKDELDRKVNEEYEDSDLDIAFDYDCKTDELTIVDF